jgi:hypothetical protein
MNTLNTLKTSLGCLFIALALNAAFTFGQGLAPGVLDNPGDDRPWLQLNCHNPSNNTTLTPKHTVIISSVRPQVKQIKENRWEISFLP